MDVDEEPAIFGAVEGSSGLLFRDLSDHDFTDAEIDWTSQRMASGLIEIRSFCRRYSVAFELAKKWYLLHLERTKSTSESECFFNVQVFDNYSLAVINEQLANVPCVMDANNDTETAEVRIISAIFSEQMVETATRAQYPLHSSPNS